MERRRKNVARFGQTWLKPPGVAKTLYQMEEERREMEEHQEALRREQLAQELADAEMEAAMAEAAAAVTRGGQGNEGGGGMEVPGHTGAGGTATTEEMGGQQPGVMIGGQGEAGGNTMMERNLDDEIPEASEVEGLNYSAPSDDSPSTSSDEEDAADYDDEGNDDDDDDEDTGIRRRAEQERHAQSLRAARAGMNHDAFREAIANPGRSIGGDMHGDDGYDDDDDGDHGDFFDEEHGASHVQGEAGGQPARQRRRTTLFEEENLNPPSGDETDMRMMMMMQEDLDDDIPDADNAGPGIGAYEHTDSEAELSSSLDGARDHESNPLPTAAAAPASPSSSSLSSRHHQHQHHDWYNHQQQQQQQQQQRGVAAVAAHGSMDLSSILSQDSSMVESYGAGLAGSSPMMQRGTRRGTG